jgi:hypothetical protein
VGFFAQLKGRLTKKHFKCATVFVNHYSRLRFVHPQLDDKSDKTLTAKLAFDQYATEHGVKILHYHCDDGRFHGNAFQQACHEARQQLTFCGVNAHFQNDIAEQAIQDLLKSAWKQLLHVHARWPEAVHFALWSYALHNAAHLHNNLPVLEDGTSRLELFSSIQVGSNLRHGTRLATQCLLYRTCLHLGVNCQDGRHVRVLGSIWGQILCTLGTSTSFSTW